MTTGKLNHKPLRDHTVTAGKTHSGITATSLSFIGVLQATNQPWDSGAYWKLGSTLCKSQITNLLTPVAWHTTAQLTSRRTFIALQGAPRTCGRWWQWWRQSADWGGVLPPYPRSAKCPKAVACLWHSEMSVSCLCTLALLSTSPPFSASVDCVTKSGVPPRHWFEQISLHIIKHL